MKCPNCSKDNAPEAKFCNECAAPLTSRAGGGYGPDHSSLLQNYIPPELAKRILSAGKQIESERRLVTILFADVSGFTAMSEKLDPEVVTTVLNDCFKGLISIVYKYEGVIDKFIGDEIMAIFGAPIAHENDAERAVRCAMEMQEYIARFNALSPVALPVPLGMHIGLNTGIVVAGNVGSDLRMNYSVIGDTVNLASRLEHVAEKGEVVISDETYRVVSALLNVEEPKTVEVKGKSEPVKTYKVLSVKSEVEPGTRVLRESPIVGRESEIAVLKAACDRLVGKKEQRIFIRGEAGVGKTRLKLELIRMAKESGVTTYEGKCSSFELNTPYYLWTTLLKSILTLGPDAGESETRKHLHDILQILSLEKHEPYLATLLSLRYEEILMEEDQDRKRRIYEGVRELVRALAGRRLSIFLFEDVHWIDRFSQELLAYLLAEESLAPAMFVPIFRDEYNHWKALMERGGELVDLNRLSTADASRLMSLRLAVDDVPASLADVIYRRSEGNPFFIEELIKTVLDKKLVTVKKRKLEIVQADFENVLPGTVQGVIMARIDRLEERLKEVLFSASVIGREFNTQLLKEILKRAETVDPSLKDLISLELVLEQEEAKEFAYLFKHYLIQEVAYNTILQKKRKELHALIAKAIEKLYPDKLKEFYEFLAFHYEKAENWEKAADYLSRAGNKAREIFTKEESNGFVERTDAAKAMLMQGSNAQSKSLAVHRAIFGLTITLWFIGSVAFLAMVITSPKKHELWAFALAILLGLFFLFFTLYAAFYLYQVLRPRAKAFTLFDDRVESILSSGASFAIPFSDVAFFHFFERKRGGMRSLWSYFKGNWNRDIYLSMHASLKLIAHRLNPTSFGFGAQNGEIHVRKQTGLAFISIKTFIRPWKFRLSAQRDLSLTPTEPREFYDQLLTAYEKWRRKTGRSTTMNNTIAPKQTVAGEPLLTLQPSYSFFATLLSLNVSLYLMLFPPALQIAILWMVLSMHPEKGVAQLYSDAPGVFVILMCFVLVFVLGILLSIRKRKRWRANRYEFYRDRFTFRLVDGTPEEGVVFYDDFSDVEVLGSIYRRLFKKGDMIISANRVLQVHPAMGLGEAAVILPDIPNPEGAAQSIRDIVARYRSFAKLHPPRNLPRESSLQESRARANGVS